MVPRNEGSYEPNRYFRRELLRLPFYRGILKLKERRHLLSGILRINECFLLVEHSSKSNPGSDQLYLYIVHPSHLYIWLQSRPVRVIKVRVCFEVAKKTWHGGKLTGMKRTTISFTTLKELVQFYRAYHHLTSPGYCRCDRSHSSRISIETRSREKGFYEVTRSPPSLFNLSSFVVRNYFYYDRDYLKPPMMPRSLFDQVFKRSLKPELVQVARSVL
jgi:hypothetical protein